MKLTIEQRLGLELRLHPQLVLMLKLLPLTALELEVLVRQELEQNPALEEVAEPDEAAEPEMREDALGGAVDNDEAGKLLSETEEGPEVGSRETAEFLDLLDPDEASPVPSAPGQAGTQETDLTELTPDDGPGLAEALMPGLAAELDREDARVAEVVLQSVDVDGFLTVSPEELAATHGFDLQRLQTVLERIRHIEPGGIACCSRREALMVQLELQGHSPDSLEYRLVAEFWPLLLQLQLGKVAELAGATEEAVRRAAECIHGLEMRPARRFSGRTADYVTPDFTVSWQEGRPRFEYNDDREPRLRLARRYVDMLRHPDRYTREQVRFARGKFNRALMYLKAIESRRQTLRRLMAAVLDIQSAFFEHGPEHLRPATLRDAAERIGVHPSTVSRAATGKYIETEFGIFPFRYFFRPGAGDKSRVGIKQLIGQLVDAENPEKPLSDEALSARLAEHGVRVPRRTVMKYRRELGIPSRGQRVRRR